MEIPGRNFAVVDAVITAGLTDNFHTIVAATLQGQARRHYSGGLDAGQRLNPLHEGAIEAFDLRSGIVLRSNQPELHGKNGVRIKAGTSMEESRAGCAHQAGAHKKYERNCEFAGDHKLAKTRATRSSACTPSAFLQCIVNCGSGALQSGRQAK